jgi:branched-subunit amino acid transport protein
MVALGAICWLLRVLFIVIVPADRLPRRILASLRHLPPAAIAALIVVEADTTVRGADAATAAAVLATLAVIYVAVRRTGSLLLAIAISTSTALVLDLVVLA